ncbi:MAG: pilus assembly protein N-terminal domain-containing protein, partial [Planctomycetaceae bacterium]|nr:pilus assembly protein N-terminal domain-containing protein [Planctomycetaceae bacterium]
MSAVCHDAAPQGTKSSSRARLKRAAGRLGASLAVFLLAVPLAAQQPLLVPYGGLSVPPTAQPVSAIHPAATGGDETVSGLIDGVNNPYIDRMLEPQYRLEIERNHSRLLLTNRPIRRIAVTDSEIVDYWQYSEKELSVVGVELGKTDLTLWFEGDENPAIYEVTVVRDRSLEE